MKKGNKKGFTLIELLAVIIILGVLMLLAVPSVSRFIERGRLNTYKSSVSSMISAVSNEVNMMEGDYRFTSTEYLVVPFACIELERGDNTSSPFNDYNPQYSAVVVARNAANGYDYFVSAVDLSGYGTEIVEQDELANTTLKAVDVATGNFVNLTGDSTNGYSATFTKEAPFETTNLTAKIIPCMGFNLTTN